MKSTKLVFRALTRTRYSYALENAVYFNKPEYTFYAYGVLVDPKKANEILEELSNEGVFEYTADNVDRGYKRFKEIRSILIKAVTDNHTEEELISISRSVTKKIIKKAFLKSVFLEILNSKDLDYVTSTQLAKAFQPRCSMEYNAYFIAAEGEISYVLSANAENMKLNALIGSGYLNYLTIEERQDLIDFTKKSFKRAFDIDLNKPMNSDKYKKFLRKLEDKYLSDKID